MSTGLRIRTLQESSKDNELTFASYLTLLMKLHFIIANIVLVANGLIDYFLYLQYLDQGGI